VERLFYLGPARSREGDSDVREARRESAHPGAEAPELAFPRRSATAASATGSP
jgi:hypothetical protein